MRVSSLTNRLLRHASAEQQLFRSPQDKLPGLVAPHGGRGRLRLRARCQRTWPAQRHQSDNKDDRMGVMARQVGELFVITSDRDAEGVHAKTVRKRLLDTYQVWTGAQWSTSASEALSFPTMDAADDYVRANFTRIMA